MNGDRPDPDQLLAQVRLQEARAARGRHKIFFGASAGVGKTFAMLSAAQAARSLGVDVVMGVIETHGRAETQALMADLPALPARQVKHKNRDFTEFDLDGALARRPGLVLVDELAHSNIAGGSRHPKRWQDVEELLAAGIDVWSTLNVQHLDSLNDIVGGITGVRIWETVPDRVFDTADEVVIVDLPPDDLLQRLKAGKVYLPQQAEEAVRHFFRKGNLIALRELALRRTADRVDGEMLQHRQQRILPAVASTRDSLLACIGPCGQGEKIVRSAARMAAQLDVPWHVVHVETPEMQRLSSAARRRVLDTLKMATDLGAQTSTVSGHDLAQTLVSHARRHNLAKIAIGRSKGGWRWPWQRALADQLAAAGEELDIIQIALPVPRRGSSDPASRSAGIAKQPPPGKRLRPYAISAAVCAATTLLASPLVSVLELSNMVMLFLLAVVAVAVRQGRGPAVLAAFLSVAAFDFFFVPPRISFAIHDIQYLVTFAVMLVVALVIGQMTAGLSYQARMAQRREDRMRALYEMSRDLSAALMVEQVAEIGARFLAAEFDARSALLVADVDDRLQDPVGDALLPDIDTAVARWAFDKSQAAGLGTDTLPASPTLYLPLSAPMRARGVLAVQPRDEARLSGPDQRRLLDTCASLLAISIERIHYIEVAQATTVQVESERLRNSLLAAISHDLRTPLTALVGMAETLTTLTIPPLPLQQAEIALAIRDSALRMNSLVTSLLDMARLESGVVRLNRQWFPLEEVVGTALAATRPALAGRPVTVAIGDDIPLVEIDAVLIERVLVNLLENAIKYTPPMTPIHVGAVFDADHVFLWVQDNGPGLPAGREESLFNKFERGQKESALPGVGLGLAICRAIAQAHGGTIQGETRPEGGARFTLRLVRGKPPTLELPDETEFNKEALS